MLAVAMFGCCSIHCMDPDPTPVQVRPGQKDVTLKLWRVLGNNDSPGGFSNNGCRLTNSQITAYILQLQEIDQRLYGPGINFVTDSMITDVSLANVNARPLSKSDFENNVIAAPPVGAGAWVPNVINVYFTGYVVSGTVAGTVDPNGAGPFGRPYIFVNDGGFANAGGFAALYTPEEMQSYHVLEHEMTHFLGRFETGTWPGGPYDADEHRPDGANNILEMGAGTPLGGVQAVHPLVIPGRWNDTELSEAQWIWARVTVGQWLDP